MRVAIISDLHGNTFALEAILEDVAGQNVDQIVIAGDSVNIHPNSKACWEMVNSLGCVVLQGNHEQYMYLFGTTDAPSEWSQPRFQMVRYFHSQFSSLDLARMQALPLTYHLPDLLICHATPRDTFKTLTPQTLDLELQDLFSDTQESCIVRGHNHNWFSLHWNNRKLWSIDAAGLPLSGNTQAAYAILTRGSTWQLEHRLVTYDHVTAVKLMNDDYIANVGALGYVLGLELATGSPHLVPFFQKYGTALKAQSITLEAAVKKFSHGKS
jgi:predicted phosphodiesterase